MTRMLTLTKRTNATALSGASSVALDRSKFGTRISYPVGILFEKNTDRPSHR